MSVSNTNGERDQRLIRWFRVGILCFAMAFLGHFVYQNATAEGARFPFKLGLDLAGGAHLVYQADTSGVDPAEVPELMNVLRDVIERRINVFGVSEPIVQVEESSFVAETVEHRLVVELPGVTDVDAAVPEIGRTPLLEFKLIDETAVAAAAVAASSTGTTTAEQFASMYVDTGLTGRYLETATLEFVGGQPGQVATEPVVSIGFNAEGAELFQRITTEHVGERLAIFLDGEMLSAPNINEPIAGGQAVISGGFTPEVARELAQNLSFGALPLPISLASTQTIDATLGASVVAESIVAGIVGFALVAGFMIFWYRLPGLVAAVALLCYLLINAALFMVIPVTLTAAGLAGFILSVGIAVDANILVFERMKEEFRAGKGSRAAAQEGFRRAWSAIRDGNVTSLLSAILLFWFGTAMIKGFALVLAVGIIVSMLSALVLTRTLLVALPDVKQSDGGWRVFLFGCGLTK